MGDVVCNGTEFSCPFCTSKLKLTVASSPANGEGKKLANMGNCFFPPPGGNCIVIPSAPVPCTPAAIPIDPGQSPVTIQSIPALGAGCKFQCAKGGLLTVSSSGQSKAKHDEASSDQVDIIELIASIGSLLPFLPFKFLRAIPWVFKIISKARAFNKQSKSQKNSNEKGKGDERKSDKENGNKNEKDKQSVVEQKTTNTKDPSPSRIPKGGTVDPKLTKDPPTDPNLEKNFHPDAKKNGRYTYKDKTTGETVHFDKGKPGTTGHEAHDHYHRENLNTTGKRDQYLDGKGNPVPRGSLPSHLYPPDY